MLVKTEITGPFMMEMPFFVVVKTCVEELKKLSVEFTRKFRSCKTISTSQWTLTHRCTSGLTPLSFVMSWYVEVLVYLDGHIASRLNYRTFQDGRTKSR